MDRMRLESVDMAAQHIEKIGALFPNPEKIIKRCCGI